MLTENLFPADIDMRRHDRVPLALFGHYSLGDGVQIPCETTDVSGNGLAMAAATGGTVGERVTIHLDGVGQLEGEIVRSFDGGFAISLAITAERQVELASQMRAIYENSALGLIEMPMLPDGEVDMSMLGGAVKFDAAMTRGEKRLVGETTARVTRNAKGDAELEFLCAGDG